MMNVVHFCSFRVLFLHRNMQYIEKDGNEFFHTLKSYPVTLEKKVTLLKYFRNYMSEHLLKVSAVARDQMAWIMQTIHRDLIAVCFCALGITYDIVLFFQAGANITPREGDEMTRLPFLRIWFRTRSAIVLYLSNGTLQVREIVD